MSLAQVDLLGRTKQAKAASQLLDKLLKQRPIDPDLWNQAADVRGQAGDLVGVHQARAEYFALTGDYNQAIQQLASPSSAPPATISWPRGSMPASRR